MSSVVASAYAQVSRVANSASGFDWSVTFVTDVEPSATSSRIVVSYNGLVGALEGKIELEVPPHHFARCLGERHP